MSYSGNFVFLHLILLQIQIYSISFILSHMVRISSFVHLVNVSRDTWRFLITTHTSLINLNKRLWIRRSFPHFNHPILWFAMQKWLLMQRTFTLFKTLTKVLYHHNQFYNGIEFHAFIGLLDENEYNSI